MGLAASQAKLLSITTRLSDNELRSQTITAAKMALSNQTSAASKKYINALNSTELLYGTYDMNGNKTTIALTGTALSEYAPLKNQYALINSAGQVLVSETQANYYEKSQNINDYLAFNGIDRIDTGETRTVTNPAYEDAYNEWKIRHDEWLANKPDPTLEKYWEETAGTDNELYQKFLNASASCYSSAMGGSFGCYLHVLAHMLELDTSYATYPKNYTTSTGKDFSIGAGYITGSAINGAGKTPDMVPISDAIQNGYKGQTMMAAEHPEDTITKDSSEGEKLLSNYTFDESGEKVLKTLSQKCKDMFYAVSNYSSLGLDYENDLKPALKSFQEDMELAFTDRKFLEDIYNEDYEEWLSKEETLEVPPTIDEIVYEYSDSDKAQWYVNLWHRMNGASDEKDGNQTTTTTNTTGYWNEMIHNESTSTTQRWAVLEDGLMNSSKWLQNALTQGTVTLEQVQYTGESTESNTGLENVSWKSIIYSSAQDITEQTDETAIAKAEAEYERAQNDIEAKDKQFDNILKLLDTEHEALQTEYESVQQVINKNISRTLKIYSA